jgi:phosphoenolpyruvate synthase/pyruvate phosphate dikinase
MGERRVRIAQARGSSPLTSTARGEARGPAKIVHTRSETGKLQRGDILVAETTMPPWTSLLAIVAAVVTDAGGVLSQGAVVARKYGIPAVVAPTGLPV